jgi:hypothetical protein
MEDEEEEEQECIWTMDARRRLLAPRRIIIIISLSLSLLSSFCAQKSSVLFVPCRKANFEAFWSVSRSFGMEKKAEVLNSLSLSPLSETQRERERERAQTIDDFIPATLVTVARRRRRFLRFSERERARERK